MRVNCVDNSSPSSLSSIELVLFKRIQLLRGKKYFVNRFRKSLLSLPYNLKNVFSSAAVILKSLFSSAVVARSIYKALTITKNTSFIKFLYWMLITSVIFIFVLISIIGPSDSVDDIINHANLTSRAPSSGYYEYSITSADVTSCAPRFDYFFSFGNSFSSSSTQASYYDHQNYRSITTADLNSWAPSFDYFFSLGNSFSSSSTQASYYDHQNYRGDEEKNSRGNEEFDSKWWLIPCITIRPRFPPRILSIRQARRAGSKKWKRRRDRFLKGYEDGTTAVDGCIANLLQKVGYTAFLNLFFNIVCRYLVALLFQCVRGYEDATAVDYFFVKLNDTAAHTLKIIVCLIRGCQFLVDEVFVCGYNPSIYSIDFLKPSMKWRSRRDSLYNSSNQKSFPLSNPRCIIDSFRASLFSSMLFVFFKLPYLAWNMSPALWDQFILTSLHFLLFDSSYFFQLTFVRNAICDIILVVYLFGGIVMSMKDILHLLVVYFVRFLAIYLKRLVWCLLRCIIFRFLRKLYASLLFVQFLVIASRFLTLAVITGYNPLSFSTKFGYTGYVRGHRSRMRCLRRLCGNSRQELNFDNAVAKYLESRVMFGFRNSLSNAVSWKANCVVDALALALFYLSPVPFTFVDQKHSEKSNLFQWACAGKVPDMTLQGTRSLYNLMQSANALNKDGVSLHAAITVIIDHVCTDETPIIRVSQAHLSSPVMTWVRQMRFRFILGIRNHAVLVVPFKEGGWGAVEIKRIPHSTASHEEGQLYLAHCSSLSLLLQQLGCGYGKSFNICVLTGKWCSRNDDGEQLRPGTNSSSLQRYQMMSDSDNTVVEAVSISDPFIIGDEATQIDSNLSSKSETDTVIPPRPMKLPKSATEAEKQERDEIMNERKRCQIKAAHDKRAKGAERSEEQKDAVAASNRKRAKDEGRGGPRDGSGRKPKDVVENSIRKGRPRCDRKVL